MAIKKIQNLQGGYWKKIPRHFCYSNRGEIHFIFGSIPVSFDRWKSNLISKTGQYFVLMKDVPSS